MEFLHIIGICPDSISHIDILDIIMVNYNEIQIMISKLKNKFNK
jgi:hypothetical protein